jgi:Shedu protein SduA, C-terminal
VAVIDAQINFDFWRPFVGYLPGYLAISEAAGTDQPSWHEYVDLLRRQWHALLDSPMSNVEQLLHEFLERHPSLLPGSDSVDGTSGHLPFPMAVISKPKLPGLSDRQPDFMWIASDSAALYPILIEIETPHRKWFYGDRAEIHSDLTHAQGQLAEWRAWFNRGQNRATFLDDYDIPRELRKRKLSPRFVLIHGRRADYESSESRLQKRAELQRQDERLMSFDRLTPTEYGELYSCVRKTQDGYQVAAVPPCLGLLCRAEDYRQSNGWELALDNCHDMAPRRREYLKEQIKIIRDDPATYDRTHYARIVKRGHLRNRQPL